MRFAVKRVDSHRSSVASRPTPPPLRGGMTLVELLVVIVLVTTLVSTAIPIISPGGEDRKLREASRNINAYFQGAQARAIETGRPFGVAMRRLSEDTGRGEDNAVVTRLEYVEVPAPYSGFDSSSLARICVTTIPNNRDGAGLRQLALQMLRYSSGNDNDRLPAGYDADLVPDRFFRPGDQVVIHGAAFVLVEPLLETISLFTGGASQLRALPIDANGGYFKTPAVNEPVQAFFTIRPVEQAQLADGQEVVADLAPGIGLRLTHDAAGNPLPSPEVLANVNGNDNPQYRYLCTTPAPFKIYRQPVPAGGESLELPNGIAIDLQASSFVNANMTRLYQPSRSARYVSDEFVPIEEPAMVLFSPEGNVEKAYLSDQGSTVSQRITDTMALCVGRRELIPPERTEASLALPNPAGYDEPIDLVRDVRDSGLSEDEQREITDKYNWLNLESRWVVIGAQSGAIRTVETSSAFPSDETQDFAGQLRAALENVQNGSKAGGQ